MKIAALNSGSNGNCYYLESSSGAILIDAGISAKEITYRLSTLGVNIADIQAIFITHEHTDHVKGLKTLSKKYEIPVYISRRTCQALPFCIAEPLVNFFEPDMAIGGFNVTAVSIPHDAADPHCFVVESDGIKTGIFTDIGKTTNSIGEYFSQCHAIFLETNYCEDMLEAGHYPYYLKRRIKGGLGHLSNKEALQFFLQYKSPYLQHLILSHLSGNNNTPEIARNMFQPHVGSTHLTVASRLHCSGFLQVYNNVTSIKYFKKKSGSNLQLSLF